MPITKAYVVSHTHWDREWYRTREEFQVDLVATVRDALNKLESEPGFEHFLLDGQAILLEDYFEDHPEDRERIRRHIESGALAVGPWYVLLDEFLVSAESIVRNLLLGHQVALECGGVQRVGYMPDSFGHVAQLPQILRGFGLDSFIYSRGNGAAIDSTGCEYWWEAPNGSRVLALHQVGGYINAGALGHASPDHVETGSPVDLDLAREQLATLLDRIDKASNTGVALINNGYDHLPPQNQIAGILEDARAQHRDVEFHHGTLAEYVNAARTLVPEYSEYRGELRHGRDHFVLSGVWSTRTHLKQSNDRLENLLAAIVEPLTSYAHFCMDSFSGKARLGELWKSLLENHPHDSICGCSIDPVHRTMQTRFDVVEHRAGAALKTLFDHVAPPAGDHTGTLLSVFNADPTRRTDIVERIIGVDPEMGPWRLVAEDGSEVPVHVRDDWTLRRVWGPSVDRIPSFSQQTAALAPYLEEFAGKHSEHTQRFLSIQFPADAVPGVGHQNYRVEAAPSETLPTGSVRAHENTIQNEHLRVVVHRNATLDVLHKGSGHEYTGLHVLEDVGDRGDSYDFAALADDCVCTSEPCEGTVQLLHASPWIACLRVELALRLPRCLLPDRNGRSSDGVLCPVTLEVTLRQGVPYVEIDLGIDNRARDHRLRVTLPTDLRTTDVGSDAHFFALKRPIDESAAADWAQDALPTRPQLEYSWLQEGERGLALLARGLPEIEASRTREGTSLSVTLLRCVEWLSRADVPSRHDANAGPTFHVPEAQCQGPQRFQYAIYPFVGEPQQLKAVSRRYRTPLLCSQGDAHRCVAGGQGLLEARSTRSAISAIKVHEERDTLVTRLYNLSEERHKDTLRLGLPVAAAWRTNMLEERQEPLNTQGTEIEVELAPHEIVTIEIAFAE